PLLKKPMWKISILSTGGAGGIMAQGHWETWPVISWNHPTACWASDIPRKPNAVWVLYMWMPCKEDISLKAVLPLPMSPLNSKGQDKQIWNFTGWTVAFSLHGR